MTINHLLSTAIVKNHGQALSPMAKYKLVAAIQLIDQVLQETGSIDLEEKRDSILQWLNTYKDGGYPTTENLLD